MCSSSSNILATVSISCGGSTVWVCNAPPTNSVSRPPLTQSECQSSVSGLAARGNCTKAGTLFLHIVLESPSPESNKRRWIKGTTNRNLYNTTRVAEGN
ncbi:hypothetical protein Pcinc_023638 [Petrolisthes cinctipes]|uniref:Uncharacterized protein n=1 Tax=Petrolisthes cinctipes TaxID=88211 RepID=A0AAE1FD42_PETCI|nr:hypothetical protein Pcinc_023638 [Petrolisthes cinctipes]